MNNEPLRWIPYERNDTLIFKNEITDSTLLLAIDSLTIRHTTSYSSFNDCGNCDDYIEVNYYYQQEPDFHVSISFDKDGISGEGYTIMEDRFDDSNCTEQNNYKIRTEQYEVVKIYEASNEYEYFKTLIVAKDYGVVALIDRNNTYWILQNDFSVENPKSFDIQERYACDGD